MEKAMGHLWRIGLAVCVLAVGYGAALARIAA